MSAPAPVRRLALEAVSGAVREARILDASAWRAVDGAARLATTTPLPPLQGEIRVELDFVAVDAGAQVALRIDDGTGLDARPPVRLRSEGGAWVASVQLASPPARLAVDVSGTQQFVAADLRVAWARATITDGIAAIVDLTRAELWPEMAQYLNHIVALDRIYVCVRESELDAASPAILAAYPQATMRTVADGDDSALAALEMLDFAIADGIELLCILHTRASAHVQDANPGRWDMLHKLVGSPVIVDDTLALLREDASLGVVGPAGHVLADDAGDFVAGSMFWARVDALRILRRARVRWQDLTRTPARPAIASELDRSLAGMLASRGYRIGETRVPDSASQSAWDFAGPDVTLPESAVEADAVPLALLPLQGVSAMQSEANAWESLHNDPQFLVEGLERFAGRWVVLEMELQAPFALQQPSIHFDVGTGWSELGAARLARPSDRHVSETICCLPPAIRRARLDPLAHPGPFRLSRLSVRPLTVMQAIARIRGVLRSRGRGLSLAMLYPAYAAMLADVDTSYASWIQRYEPKPAGYAQLAAAHRTWSAQPLFTIALDARGADFGPLLDSLTQQVYPHWELIVAQENVVGSFPDPRLRVVDVAREPFATAMNVAVRHARGDFVGLARAQDRLHPLALHYLAQAAVERPGCAMLYGDEDRFASDGKRMDPWFKCAWNADLMLSMDAAGSFTCWRTTLLRANGFNDAASGAEAYDFSLWVADRAGSHGIVHVPRVLYHAAERRQPSVEGARAAVQAHLERTGEQADVLAAPFAPGLRRVRYALPEPAPEVAIVIPTRDAANLVHACVDSIRARTTYPRYRIVIVDNGSVQPQTAELLEAYRRDGIEVLRDDREFNFSALNNAAVAAIASEFVCLLNNDMEIQSEEWLEEMVGHAARPGVGAVGARLWYPDGRLQHGGLVLGIAGLAGYAHRLLPKGEPGYASRAVVQQGWSAVTAACLLVRRKLYQTVGGLDERLAVAFNDVDFCLRLAAAGHRTVWTPYAQMVHLESATRGAESTPEKAKRLQAEIDLFRERWGLALFTDPAYSPNLTLDAEDFSLAWPPRLDLSPIISG